MLSIIVGEKSVEKKPAVQTTIIEVIEHFFSEYGTPVKDFKNGTLLLYPHKDEELPLYLRSDLLDFLKELDSLAKKENAVIVFRDRIQKELLNSSNIYPSSANVKKLENTTIKPPIINKSMLEELGILPNAKLLLLEKLFSERTEKISKLNKIRKDKVFVIDLGESTPSDKFRIVKFDSPSLINTEYDNFEAIIKKIKNHFGNKSTKLGKWMRMTYNLDVPIGHNYDLLKGICSTVEAQGSFQDWSGATLKGKWSFLQDKGKIIQIIDSVFDILRILYGAAGLKCQETTTVELYRNFYHIHIIPADCILKCDLDELSLSDVVASKGHYPPKPGAFYADNNYTIIQIKLRSNSKNPYSTDPNISLLIEKEEKRIELDLNPLSKLPASKLYDKEIREKQCALSFKGKCEDNYKTSLCHSVVSLNIIKNKIRENNWGPEEISFITGDSHKNPLYYYGQIYDRCENPDISLKLNTLMTWIHGDLNVGNIIVGKLGNTYNARIIDFARLFKCAPVEFDFAELETDIKISLLNLDCDKMITKIGKRDDKIIVKEIFSFENELLNIFNSKEPNYNVVNQHFHKGLSVIAEIRNKLICIYNSFDKNGLFKECALKSYMTAVFFESLASLRFTDDPISKIWAFIAATVACEKLLSLNDY